MQLKSLRIQNFRAFNDTTIELGPYNCFVGANGAGKSSILAALNIFFRESANPTNVNVLKAEDFHLKDTSRPIKITVTFTDLTPEAEEDLKEYVRHNQLVVSAKATWNKETTSAEVVQHGSRLVIEDFAEFFQAEKEGKKVAELREIYKSLSKNFPDLPTVSTKKDMTTALREYEGAHEELCTLKESSDQFYGWSKGANRLAPYCQWIFVPAVKDATEEEFETRASALGQLLERTIRSKVDFKPELQKLEQELSAKYTELLGDHQELLSDLSTSLESRLRDWAHPGVRVEVSWHYDENKSVVVNPPVAKVALGEGPFIGELARLGHGIQRSFIVTLLQELAAADSSKQPNLILGIEEPELYQHPPQAYHLATLLQSLTKENQSQIVVSTHSPYFISGKGFESVRLTRKNPVSGVSEVSSLTHEQLSAQLAKALQKDPVAPSNMMAVVEQIMQPSQNELFFARVPILVEGTEDVAFITSHLHLFGHWEEFRKHGCHFIVCGGKTSMSRPLAIAVGLGLKPFVVFDGDGNDNGKQTDHERNNGCLLRLCGVEDRETFTTETLWFSQLVMWGTQLKQEVSSEVGEDAWQEARQGAFSQLELSEKVSKKNPLWIASTIEQLSDKGVQSEKLEKLCQAILSHAKGVSEPALSE